VRFVITDRRTTAARAKLIDYDTYPP